MNQPDASWKWNPNTNQWSATLIDAQDIEWQALVEKADFNFVASPKFAAKLFARKIGVYCSSNTFLSVEEAKAWCYSRLNITE